MNVENYESILPEITASTPKSGKINQKISKKKEESPEVKKMKTFTKKVMQRNKEEKPKSYNFTREELMGKREDLDAAKLEKLHDKVHEMFPDCYDKAKVNAAIFDKVRHVK